GRRRVVGVESGVGRDLCGPRRPEVVRFFQRAGSEGYGRVPRAARNKAAFCDGGARRSRRVRGGILVAV
ncbi:MAG: Membrane protein, distant similarity to thiosulphate:quinone oxidoreductase DoxD, partial [uncultured Rubrobacteraceae bacterium]